MTVRKGKMNGIVCGRNIKERVILWDDDTFERISHAEFERRFLFLI